MSASQDQVWMLTQAGEIRQEDSCFDVTGDDLYLERCSGEGGSQVWRYEGGALIHGKTSLCVELGQVAKAVVLSRCAGSTRQGWMRCCVLTASLWLTRWIPCTTAC